MPGTARALLSSRSFGGSPNNGVRVNPKVLSSEEIPLTVYYCTLPYSCQKLQLPARDPRSGAEAGHAEFQRLRRIRCLRQKFEGLKSMQVMVSHRGN